MLDRFTLELLGNSEQSKITVIFLVLLIEEKTNRNARFSRYMHVQIILFLKYYEHMVINLTINTTVINTSC